MPAARVPLVLDTDPGSDIDDAVALAYLLRQPRCELLGVTTVSGDVRKRAAIAELVCAAAGRGDVPVVAGAERPLLFGPGQPNVPHYDAVKDRPHRTDYPTHAAVDFLRRTIRARPGEVTLLTVGPLTNVALLFALDPEIPSLLKGLVTMGGVFFPAKFPEWNLNVDPVAAAMVYAARVPGHVSYGLDVTTRCQMPPGEVRKRFAKPPLDVVLAMAEVWFGHAKTITFHDPLAAAGVFVPDLCTYERGEVTIDASPDHKQGGLSTFTPSPTGPHAVARTVDADRFFAEYFARLG